MFIEILKYGFLLIFFSTAILGIVSIPGWIKIPEWYRKKIFIALILEVVGVVIILFNQEFINSGSRGTPDIAITDHDWVALNENGLIVKPKVVVKTNDTLITKSLGKQAYLNFKDLTGKMAKGGLNIINSDSISLGTIDNLSLKQNGLFHSFKTANGEISSTENYSYIKWEKSSSGKWRKRGAFIGPFEIKITDYDEGTYYEIINIDSNVPVFDSRKSSKNLFSVDNRIIHFFQYEDVFYLLRIAQADLKSNKKYVHIINVRMEPVI